MGYDESLFVKPLDSYWLCPICDDGLEDAVETPCCEKIFCYSCLRDWIVSHQRSCPHCRTILDVAQIGKRDKRANKYIREQLVKCPHKETHSCNWTGHVSDIDEHCTKSCQSSAVRCPFHTVGCEAKLTRNDLSNHMKEEVAQHLTLAMLKIGDLSNQVTQLSTNMIELKTQQMETLNKKVDHLRSEMLPLRNTTLALSGYLIITIPRSDFVTKQFNECIDSQPFEYAGFQWKIRVYPRGDRQDKEGFSSFYLWSEHNYEQNPKDLEVRYTLSFENKNHQCDVVVNQTGGVLGANFTFTKNIGNGWSLKGMNERFTTEYMAERANGFIHEEDDCLHIRACILDVKPHSRIKKC
jgi:hypothetical protein